MSGQKRSDTDEMTFAEHIDALRPHLVRGVLAILALAVAAFLCKGLLIDGVLFGPMSAGFPTNRLLVWMAGVQGSNSCRDRALAAHQYGDGRTVQPAPQNLDGRGLLHRISLPAVGVVALRAPGAYRARTARMPEIRVLCLGGIFRGTAVRLFRNRAADDRIPVSVQRQRAGDQHDRRRLLPLDRAQRLDRLRRGVSAAAAGLFPDPHGLS